MGAERRQNMLCLVLAPSRSRWLPKGESRGIKPLPGSRGLWIPGVMEAVGVVHCPEIQRPDRSPEPLVAHAAVHKDEVGSTGVYSFVDYRMAPLLNLIHVIAHPFVQVHKEVHRRGRLVLLLAEDDGFRRV